MKKLLLAIALLSLPALTRAEGPILEVSEPETGGTAQLLVKISHEKDDETPFLRVTLPGGEGGIIPADGEHDVGYLLSRNGRTLAYGIKNATKNHQLNAVVMSSGFGLKINDSINIAAGKQIKTTKRGRKFLGRDADLGWAYFTAVTDDTVSFRAGVWTKEGGAPEHFTCTVWLMPEGTIKVISWNLEAAH